jgi:hypothetical protein
MNRGTGARVYKRSSRWGHSFSFGLHTTLFQAEIYAIKACIMEYIQKGYTGMNTYILSNNSAAKQPTRSLIVST